MPAGAATLYAAWKQSQDFHFPYEYQETAQGVIIAAYTGNAQAETMPGEVNGMPVVGIGEAAFANTNLTALTLGSSVTSIGSMAFAGTGYGFTIVGWPDTAAIPTPWPNHTCSSRRRALTCRP